MADPQSRRNPALRHAVSLAKGAAHHVGALLLMTIMRGILVTALGASGMAAVSAFLPHELRPATEHATTELHTGQVSGAPR